ncbi:MAG: glycoside hydrolase family 57 protein [Phycisphaeraceae bacterium]
MPAVCFYFQVHQPTRLRRYSVFDTHSRYFDDEQNRTILRKVAGKCYLPATNQLLEMVRKHDGRFRVAFSLTGSVIDQLKAFAPEVLDNFRALAATGCVEFLAETYNHSLAMLYSPEEFAQQVAMHSDAIETLFNQRPSIFRNTELIYSDKLVQELDKLGRHRAVLAEGASQLLQGRSPNVLYSPAGHDDFVVLLKNYKLSDDVAFRFSDTRSRDYPLTARKFADKLAAEDGDVVNLFLDFETFGEHQWRQTGIFDFLCDLPGHVFAREGEFITPSDALEFHEPHGTISCPHVVSWADSERDVSAWLGNAMQTSAMHELYRLEQPVKATGDEALLRDWRRLTNSDHVYYMSTKHQADAAVHSYFSPYESPYDAYINYMNVLDDLRGRLGDAAPSEPDVL